MKLCYLYCMKPTHRQLCYCWLIQVSGLWLADESITDGMDHNIKWTKLRWQLIFICSVTLKTVRPPFMDFVFNRQFYFCFLRRWVILHRFFFPRYTNTPMKQEQKCWSYWWFFLRLNLWYNFIFITSSCLDFSNFRRLNTKSKNGGLNTIHVWFKSSKY